MDIIEDSGILIFKGRQALSGRVLRDKGKNEHLENVLSSKHMLINFIHSSLRIASFIGMVKITPSEAAALNKKVGEDCTEEAGESDYASAIEEEDEQMETDPPGLEKLSLSPKPETNPNPQIASPVPPFLAPTALLLLATGAGPW